MHLSKNACVWVDEPYLKADYLLVIRGYKVSLILVLRIPSITLYQHVSNAIGLTHNGSTSLVMAPLGISTTFAAQNSSGKLPRSHASLNILLIHLAEFSVSALVVLLWILSSPGARFVLVFSFCSTISLVEILR